MRADGLPRRDAPFNGEARQADGLTVFASDDAGCELALLRRQMPLRVALAEIAAELDKRPGRWRIDCISTPQTIWRDLQGVREQARQQRDAHLAGGVAETEYPERILLGAIGRLDLWRDPRTRSRLLR